MLGEREAVVLEARGLDVHGVAYVDIALGYRDGTTTAARVGRESAPDDLRAGEVVLVSTAMSVVVAVRRPEGPTGIAEEPDGVPGPPSPD